MESARRYTAAKKKGCRDERSLSFHSYDISDDVFSTLVEDRLTHVIHAPVSGPNAIAQAGSRDWKYSSG